MLALLSSAPAAAQRRSGAAVPNKPELGSLGERINANTVAVISGNLNATYVTIAYDLSAVLGDGDDFRILRARDKTVEREQFIQFVARRAAKPVALSTEERDRLFQEFLSWSKTRERR